ncbi:MAG: VanZ family protein [Chromatiales bacterium]|nr:VanZ family protein [Chromatiales bacterium]
MDSKQTLRYYKFWLVIGWGLVLTVTALSIIPSPPEVSGSDKLHHFVAYGTLMGWFGQIYHQPRTRILWFIGFVVMGVLLEIIQGVGGVRHFEYADMAANAAGALIGLLLSRGWSGRLIEQFERRVLCRY